MASAPSAVRRSTSSAACSRDRVTSTRRPNRGRASYQRRCGRNPTTRPTTSVAGPAAGSRAACRAAPRWCRRPFPGRQRAVVDDDRRSVRGPAVRAERLEHERQLVGARVTHDGAPESRQAGPVDVGERPAFVFVSPNEGNGVAGPRDRSPAPLRRRVPRWRRAHPERPRTARAARRGTALPRRRGRTRTGRPTSAAPPSCPRAPSRRAGS